MDEILIEEKKYISSKRAAKITGYAKDYIGQLCREGRVPARLVGRSWYVLETAIQDHRFGNQEISQEKPTETPVLNQQAPKPEEIPSSTWESPRYEASTAEILPTVNRLREETDAFTGDKEETKISDSWREWFDRIAEAEAIVPVVKKTEEKEEETMIIENKEIEEQIKEEPVEMPIPIHTIYRQPPQELLPHSSNEEGQSQEQPLLVHNETKRRSKLPIKIIKMIQVCGLTIATITTTLAILGSGYLDKYIISISPVSIIAGVALYNK